jgi:hypothetical protein
MNREGAGGKETIFKWFVLNILIRSEWKMGKRQGDSVVSDFDLNFNKKWIEKEQETRRKCLSSVYLKV